MGGTPFPPKYRGDDVPHQHPLSGSRSTLILCMLTYAILIRTPRIVFLQVPDCPPGLTWILSSILVTSDKLYVCKENFGDSGFELVASRPLDAASAITADGNGVCLLEFDSETDELEPWTVLFKTKNSLEVFASIVNSKWKELYQVDLLVTGVTLIDELNITVTE